MLLLMLAYPGTTYEWWADQLVEDEQLVATAVDLIEKRAR